MFKITINLFHGELDSLYMTFMIITYCSCY